MRVLALDTTTRAGSVALLDGERIVEERAGDGARTHAERLPAEITSLIESHHLTLADIDLYAVGSGPGSFTGLRIGIATIQGLALVHGRRIAPISALEAIGHLCAAGAAPGTLVGAWMDAHRREVFSALYRISHALPFSAEHLQELEGPTVGDPAAAPAARLVPPTLLAGAIGRLALAREPHGIDPGAMRPLYVRRPDAEIARDEKLRAVETDHKAH